MNTAEKIEVLQGFLGTELYQILETHRQQLMSNCLNSFLILPIEHFELNAARLQGRLEGLRTNIAEDLLSTLKDLEQERTEGAQNGR